MTAMDRRKMLGVMLAGTLAATAGLSMISRPGRSRTNIAPPTGCPIGLRLCPPAFAAASNVGGGAGGGGDVESAAGAGSRRMATSGFRPLSTEDPVAKPFNFL